MPKKRYIGIFESVSNTVYKRLHLVEIYYNRPIAILITDGLNRKYVIPVSRSNNIVDCYENNNIFLKGGFINDNKIYGLYEKIKSYHLDDKANVLIKNMFL